MIAGTNVVRRPSSLFVGSLALSAVLLAVEAREIKVNLFSVKPGETLRLEMPRHYHVSPTVTWRNTAIEFKPTWDNHWRALIPIPIGTAPSEEEMFIDPRAPSNPELYEGPLKITILPAPGLSEVISAPAEKAALLGNSDEEEESKLIREFLRAAISDGTQYWRGPFEAPVPGKILSHFGINRKRTEQVGFADYHRGIDFAGKRGEPVKAPNDAVVLLAKEFNFHGKTVLLSHGQGVCSIYLHLDEIDITEGERLKKGQILGRVGSTGFATGPHLHWGVYVEAQPVDPEQWLNEDF